VDDVVAALDLRRLEHLARVRLGVGVGVRVRVRVRARVRARASHLWSHLKLGRRRRRAGGVTWRVAGGGSGLLRGG